MFIVGLMSGTSADAIDAALCDIQGAPPQLRARIVHAITFPYPQGFQAHILRMCLPSQSSVDQLCLINFELAALFAEAALRVIAEAGMHPDQIDLIGSHGQTLWHQVQPDGTVKATLQIGDGSVIAEKTGITTINNFRSRDVAAGGQGAPLTGYADWLLLSHPTRWRAVQNIGGIGNVTFLPPLSDSTSTPLAFDTGPGNALIDSTVALLTQGVHAFDADSALARRGRISEEWLQELLSHPYYERKPPKTTGRELFGASMAAELLESGRARGLDEASIVSTLTMLTATTIADAYARFAPAQVEEIILGGGGRRNPFMVEALRGLIPSAAVISHEDVGIDSDNKEALVFALLAHESWHNRPGTHPALTGAHYGAVLGQITPGRNYQSLIQRTWCAPKEG